MTARELVIQITQNRVPVYRDTIAFCKGGGFYHWDTGRESSEFVCLGRDDASDGQWLAIACHEAFHALRHLQGVQFYTKKADELTIRDWAIEELEVNRSARSYLLPLLDEDDRWYAERTFNDIDKEYGALVQ